MLLAELTGYKKYGRMTLDGLVKLLNGQQGYFGAVIFGDHSKYVYKVWAVDPGYEKWLKAAAQHQDNPWFPKIIRPPKEVLLPLVRDAQFDSVNVVRIERLEPITNPLVVNLINLTARIFTWDKKQLLQKIMSLKSPVRDDLVGTKVADSRHLIMLEVNQAASSIVFLLDKLKLSRKEYCDALDVLNEKAHDFDLAVNNVMMRGSQPVFTDPYGSSREAVTLTDVSSDYLFDLIGLSDDTVATGHPRKYKFNAS